MAWLMPEVSAAVVAAFSQIGIDLNAKNCFSCRVNPSEKMETSTNSSNEEESKSKNEMRRFEERKFYFFFNKTG